MGYAYYEITRPNGEKIEAGYEVEAVCEEKGCEAEIDRGLAYLCGKTPGGDEHGCGGYYCGQHLYGDNQCTRCQPALDDVREPCGESHCRCYGEGAEHYECACGCDCPRDSDGELLTDG
ncbi:hypothetical protein [Streptomyces sp. NPDC059970]|uniref:hypothetical protein n=1 Tax=Streptomyces sp. NPDC059970 TaxID=3347019 RepID=UPI0036AD17F6